MVNEHSKKEDEKNSFSLRAKNSREKLFFCPFFDINSALFSVPLI